MSTPLTAEVPEARVGAGHLLAARAAGHEYDPDRVARFDELASLLAAIPPGLDLPPELPALAVEPETSLPFFEAYFSNFIEGTGLFYFWHKADTPGCTTQACSVRDARADIDAAGAVVIGISPDTPAAPAADGGLSEGHPPLHSPKHR